MTNDEMNREVAVAMGYSVQPHQRGERHGFRLMRDVEPQGINLWTHESGAWSSVPAFCTDPAAADLVRLEIERRGWWWRLDYADMNGARSPMPNYQCAIGGKFLEGTEYEYDGVYKRAGSPHMALCLAFLAAVEAEKEVSDDIQ